MEILIAGVLKMVLCMEKESTNGRMD